MPLLLPDQKKAWFSAVATASADILSPSRGRSVSFALDASVCVSVGGARGCASEGGGGGAAAEDVGVGLLVGGGADARMGV